MTTVSTTDSKGKLPRLPDSRCHQADDFGNGIRVRAFGARQTDLDIDFERSQRPVLISQLLQACVRQIHGADPATEDPWQWSIRQRLQALLSIVVETRGPRMSLTAVCEQPGCRKPMDLDLNLLDFCDTHPEDTFSCRPDDDTQIQLRLPTGLDQLGWLKADAHRLDDISTHMATSLVLQVNGKKPEAGWRVPDHWLDNLADAMERHDALTTLQLHSCCPACRRDLAVDVDLEGELLAVLGVEHTHLLHQIHRLASVYHWTESDILAMPAKRRNDYLRMVDEGSQV